MYGTADTRYEDWQDAQYGDPDAPTGADLAAAGRRSETEARLHARRTQRALDRGDLVLDPLDPWAQPHVPGDRVHVGSRIRTRNSGGPWVVTDIRYDLLPPVYGLRGTANDGTNVVTIDEIVEVVS